VTGRAFSLFWVTAIVPGTEQVTLICSVTGTNWRGFFVMAKPDPDPVVPGLAKRRVSQISDAYLLQLQRRKKLEPGLRDAIEREITMRGLMSVDQENDMFRALGFTDAQISEGRKIPKAEITPLLPPWLRVKRRPGCSKTRPAR
jgi:hypothetical protein